MTILKLPSIHIHPVLLLFIVIAMLTGTFVELILILSIVFIHELGHYTAAIYYHWRIKNIVLWVFGGIMNTEEHGSKPIKEELIVTLAGPFQHFFIYIVIYLLSITTNIPLSIIDMALYYNTMILLFNLLPIWPLDGGKLIFLVLSRYLPFRKAHHYTIFLSVGATVLFLIVQFVFFPFTLSAFFILIFILMENRLEWKRRFYVFIRFLLNKYDGDEIVRKVESLTVPSHLSLINVFNYFKREIHYAIYVTYPDNSRLQIDENDCLHTYFYEKDYRKNVGDIGREQNSK